MIFGQKSNLSKKIVEKEKKNLSIVVSNTVVSVQYYGNTGCGVFKRGYKIRKTKNQHTQRKFFEL